MMNFVCADEGEALWELTGELKQCFGQIWVAGEAEEEDGEEGGGRDGEAGGDEFRNRVLVALVQPMELGAAQEQYCQQAEEEEDERDNEKEKQQSRATLQRPSETLQAQLCARFDALSRRPADDLGQPRVQSQVRRWGPIVQTRAAKMVRHGLRVLS